jgi:hypothetical protein
MPKSTGQIAQRFDYCIGCPEACVTIAEVEQKQARKLCDPCDGCFNFSSPACSDCDAPSYQNFEFDGGEQKAATERLGSLLQNAAKRG